MSCIKSAATFRLFLHTIFACAFLSFLTTAAIAQGPGPDAELLFTTQHPDPDSGDAFGQSFDSSTIGDGILAVGTPMDAVDGNAAEGSVQIYEAGAHTASLTAPDGQAYSKFGSSVSINDAGDVIAVGAPGPSDGENGGVDFSGKIYLYHNADDGTGWNFLTVIAGTDDEGYGSALDQSGDWIAVGAPSASNTHNNQGAVHMILMDGDCIYNSDHTVYAVDPQDDASFGSALSLAYDSEFGETLLIGDPGNDELGADAGAVYDAYLDEVGEFMINWKYTADDAEAGAEFGASVSTIQDTYFAVGAPGDAGVGAVYELRLDDNYQDKIQPCDLEAGDRFGASVSYTYELLEEIEEYEYIIAAGAPMADRIWTEGAVAHELLDAGKVYVFNYPHEIGEWNLTAIVSRGTSAEAGAHFGHAVLLEGMDQLLVSAPEEDGQGLLYTYELIDGTPPAVDVLDVPDYATCEDGDDYVLDLQEYITNTSNDALEFSINGSFIQSTELSVSNAGSVVTVDFSPLGAFEQDITVDVHNIMTCEDLSITFHVTEVPYVAGLDVEASETSSLLTADGAIEVTTFGYGTEIVLSQSGLWIDEVAGDSAVFSGLLAGEYLIDVTFENGCQNSELILVVPAPPVWDQVMPADTVVDCHDVPLPLDATASDPCDSEAIVTFEESEAAGECPQEQLLTRVWTATDCEGNSTEHVQVLTVVDTFAPSFVEMLPADMEAPCDAIPAAETMTATDLCDASPSVSFVEEIIGDCPSTYLVRRTWTAQDACGNETTHVQDIQLVDDVSPAFVEALPGDFDISCDANLPEPDVLTATDQCDNAPQVEMVEVTSDDACANDRTVTRTWTASDCAGNTTVHTQVISLYDDIAPVMHGDEIAFLSCDEWPADPTFENLQAAGIIDASDNCSLDHVDIEFTEMSGGCNHDHILLYTPYDACGNQGDSHYQIVQIDDDEAPVFTSVPAAITLDCADDIEAYLEMATAVDNCDDAVNMTYIDEITPTDCPEEYTITRLFRAEDCGYNSAIATQIITVDDSTDPSLTLTAPLDAQISGCYASADMSETANGSVSWVTADDCGEVSVSYTVSDDATFDCDFGSEGSHTVVRTFTVTAMDCAGNSTTASTTQTITITDDEAPTVLFDCPIPVTVYLDEDCAADAVAENSLNDGSGMGAVADDNCDSDVYTTTSIISETDTYLGAVDGVGSYETARTYEIVAYDNCGNSTTAECTQTISVLDTISPEVDLSHGADIDLYVDENGYVDTTPFGLATGAEMNATDNCSGSTSDATGADLLQLVGGIIITELADPNSSYAARFVEIHNSSSADQDMSGYSLVRWTNGGSSMSSNVIDLSTLGTLSPGEFAVIASRSDFTDFYGFDADIVAGTGGPADSNGDDQVAIMDGGGNIVDIFGVIGEDGSNTCHEFEDGRAERAASNVAPNGGAWDEAGWNVWSDYSNASGCTNHSSNDTQETADMDPGSWIGAEATIALITSISYSDEITDENGACCFTIERTWSATAEDNNGNSTTVTSLQTINVIDAIAPTITADATGSIACDFFGYDLTQGGTTVIAGTSFEEPSSGGQYTDTGEATEDHALSNNPGESDVNFTSTGGEIGFSAEYINSSGSVGLTDGDFFGTASYAGDVGAFTDGGQGYQMSDVDGTVVLTFDAVDVSMGGVNFSMDLFVKSTGWEAADFITITLQTGDGDIEVLNTAGEDIDNLGLEGQWNGLSADLSEYEIATLVVAFSSNSGSEVIYLDNISFAQGSDPLADLMAEGFVSFSDNCVMGATSASIVLTDASCQGSYEVSYSAMDECGNTSNFLQVIELLDMVNPVLTTEFEPADITLNVDENCTAAYGTDVTGLYAVSAMDNCDSEATTAVTFADAAPVYLCEEGNGSYTITRTFSATATDNCGNTDHSSYDQLITFIDAINPDLSLEAPEDRTLVLSSSCDVDLSIAANGEPTVSATDNCDSDVDTEWTHSDSEHVLSCDGDDDNLEGSYTFTRTFTAIATDACGNETSSTVDQLIVVVDGTQPSITSLEQLGTQEYFLGTDCSADLTPVVEPAHTESDACDSDVATALSYADGLTTQTCDGDDGTNSGSYSFTRTWILVAVDDCGNQSTAMNSQSIVVTDATDPTILATYPADYDTDFDANCSADGSTDAAGMATSTATDNCDDQLAIEISYADHDTIQLAVNLDDALEGGFSFTRTWTVTATDDCGNSSTESNDQTLSFHDVIAPTAEVSTLPSYGVYADEDCNADVSPAAAGTPETSAADACDSDVSIDLTFTDGPDSFENAFGDYGLEIDTVAVDGILGMTTVRIYITTENATDFLSAVAGDAVNPTVIRSSTSFYQDALGATLGSDLLDLDPAIAPDLAYDSWVTIGLDGAPSVDDQPIQQVGDWVTDFAAGGDIMINSFYGGSWFSLYPSEASVAGDDNRVLIAQLTTDGLLSGQIFAQVFPEGDGDGEFRVSFTFGDCAEDDDTPEGGYSFLRTWHATASDDANNQTSVISYQSVQVSDTTAPQLTNTCDMMNGAENVFPCAGIAVLDLDPVPVPCDVTAIDNCDSEVNVNLFTETSGHVPTSAIQNYCAPVTPEAQDGSMTCDERAPEAIRLFNFPGDEAFVVDASGDESIVEVGGDGSLHIELHVTNADGTGGFAWSADYGAGLDWSEWSALGRSYKKDCNEIFPGENVWEDWAFFLMTSGTMEGTGIYAGSSMDLSHQPSNNYFGLQAGAGANNKNTNYGASAWFFWNGQVVIDGQDLGTLASSGDIFIDLDCCLPWQVDYSYTAMDDCGNPTGFAYTDRGTDATSNGGGDISGGHGGGPVVIGGSSNLKDPIRITGLAPNPTNDHSQLTFTVSSSMRLRVDLYTMSGVQVQELYDGNAMTGVQYAIDIDTDALSSGMYQIRISSNVYMAVKKLLVTD